MLNCPVPKYCLQSIGRFDQLPLVPKYCSKSIVRFDRLPPVPILLTIHWGVWSTPPSPQILLTIHWAVWLTPRLLKITWNEKNFCLTFVLEVNFISWFEIRITYSSERFCLPFSWKSSQNLSNEDKGNEMEVKVHLVIWLQCNRLPTGHSLSLFLFDFLLLLLLIGVGMWVHFSVLYFRPERIGLALYDLITKLTK